MKKLLLAFASVFVLAMGSGYAQAASTKAEQVIRPIMTKMLAAANAHDTDAFMAPMVRKSTLVFAINGEVIHGWGALHAQQRKWWRNGKSDARYRSNGQTEFMALGPDVEIVTWSLASSRILADGKTSTSAFVVTYVWQRLPQGWRIVYGHESWTKPPG
ncbi:MAG: YybH family protein [Rhodanobacteraceae bacterium]